jgi:hypothetical protein
VVVILGIVGCVFSAWGSIYSYGTNSSCGGCIIWERGDSSVEGAFLELGHFSFVGRLYVLEEGRFSPLLRSILFATELYQLMGVIC